MLIAFGILFAGVLAATRFSGISPESLIKGMNHLSEQVFLALLACVGASIIAVMYFCALHILKQKEF